MRNLFRHLNGASPAISFFPMGEQSQFRLEIPYAKRKELYRLVLKPTASLYFPLQLVTSLQLERLRAKTQVIQQAIKNNSMC